MKIDISFDLRSDTVGDDTDKGSETLRQYHKILWSKPLPCGAVLDLSDRWKTDYLLHDSPRLGRFRLSSDAIVPSYSTWETVSSIVRQMPSGVIEAFDRLVYSIGGRLVFPGNQIDRLQTINQAKGFERRTEIADRMDLTLECIRRHYAGAGFSSPLTATLARYAKVFELFGDFEGYVRFFLLDDLVTDSLDVRFALDFDDFETVPAWPRSLDEYKRYLERSMEFLEARNGRIERLHG